MSEWVSVKDRLPEIGQFVLWYYSEGHMGVWEINKDGPPFGDPTWIAWPTHWRVLPDGPGV